MPSTVARQKTQTKKTENNVTGIALKDTCPFIAGIHIQKLDKAAAAFGNDVMVGDVIEIFYVPETGSTFRSKDAEVKVEGKEVNEILWNVFFGPNACCEEVKTAILAMCDQ